MSDELQRLQILFDRVMTHQARGEYALGLEVVTPLIDLARSNLGPQHPDVAEILSTAGILSRRTGQLERAESFYREALAIRLRAFGNVHPAVAASLNNLGTLYFAMGKHSDAEPMQRASVAIKQQLFGDDAPEVALAMSNLAATHMALKNFAEAERLLDHALRIYAATAESPNVIEVLVNLTSLHDATGHPAEALSYARRAYDASRVMLVEGHPAILERTRDLAWRYFRSGDFAAARPLNEQALAITRRTLGEEHPDTVRALINLGRTNYALGAYAQSEPLLQRALEITRRTSGANDAVVAECVNDLAMLYRDIGSLQQAETLFLEALHLIDRSPSRDQARHAIAMNNLAALYRQTRRYERAQELFERAIAIQRSLPTDEEANLAQTLNNLALLHAERGDHAAAEPLLEDALRMTRRAHGDGHQYVATVLNNLAETYREIGRYADAEVFQREANERYERTLGSRHPRLERGLMNLAKLYAATGRPAEALAAQLRAVTIDDHTIGDVFSISSDQQRSDYVEMIVANVHAVLSLVLQSLADSPEAVRSAFELVLRRKAIEAEVLAAQRHAILRGGHATLPGMDAEQRARTISRDTVSRTLPEGSALVELVQFPVRDYAVSGGPPERQWKADRYVAFVMRSGEPDDVQMFDLGEAKHIDELITSLRAAISGGDGLYAIEPDETDAATTSRDGAALRSLVFDPIMAGLGDCTRMFIAPDGALARLPFEILPLGDGRCVIDAYEISYLSTGRDVLRFGLPIAAPGTPAVVVADPDFDLTALAGSGSESTVAGAPTNDVTIEQASEETDPLPLYFPRLPETRVEGERIAAILGARLIMGEHVLEGRLKDLRSPRILHIATHGYFLPSESRTLTRDVSGVNTLSIDTPANDDAAVTMMMIGRSGDEHFGLGQTIRSGRFGVVGLQNAMLRSGLAVAGANTWLKHGPLPVDAEDGLLSAEDVSALDLFSTQLVMMSACETGLGDIRNGEGVLGLRRACVLAGARTLVSTLWKVPDEQTRELMEDFYQRLLRGEPRAASLRSAQLALKEKHPDPFYWGAFICQGEPGVLVS